MNINLMKLKSIFNQQDKFYIFGLWASPLMPKSYLQIYFKKNKIKVIEIMKKLYSK